MANSFIGAPSTTPRVFVKQRQSHAVVAVLRILLSRIRHKSAVRVQNTAEFPGFSSLPKVFTTSPTKSFSALAFVRTLERDRARTMRPDNTITTESIIYYVIWCTYKTVHATVCNQWRAQGFILLRFTVRHSRILFIR